MAHYRGWKNTNNTVRSKHLRSLVKMLLLYNFPVECTFWQIDKLCISITIWVSFTCIFYIIISFYIITLDLQLFGGGVVLCFKGTKIALGFFRIKFGSRILFFSLIYFSRGHASMCIMWWNKQVFVCRCGQRQVVDICPSDWWAGLQTHQKLWGHQANS